MVLVWLLVIAAVLRVPHHASATIQQCDDGSIVGMASPAYMIGGRDIRTVYGRGYVMTNPAYVSSCCGVVKQWTFHRDRRALDNPLTFHIWRPGRADSDDDDDDDDDGRGDGVSNAGTTAYRLVGKTDHYAEMAAWYNYDDRQEFDGDDYGYDDDDDEDDDDDYDWKTRVVSVPLAEDQRISIRPGDLIGWRSPQGDVISYTTRYYNLDNIVINRMGEMEVGDSYEFPSPLMSHRTYGMNAVLTRGAAPVITNLPSRVQLPSDVMDMTFVFRVTGHDDNPGDILAYRIDDEKGDVDDLPFSIDHVTGTISVQGRVRETRYQIPVRVEDPCGLYDVGWLTVDVLISTTAPVVVLPETLTIPVNSGPVEYSYSIVISDDDDDNDLTCNIADVTPPVTIFSVERVNLHVKLTDNVTSAVEKQQEMTYTVRVTCTDGTNDVTRAVKVKVFHYAPPRFVNSSVTTVHVSARVRAAGDVIHVLEATSSADSSLVFWAEDCGCPFHLYPDGRIAVTHSLMTEPVTSYSLTVYVSDGVVQSEPATVYFSISDINHPPQFQGVPSSILMEENSSGEVLKLSATDADGDFIAMSLTWTPETAGTFFVFNETSRLIIVRPTAILDFEVMNALGLAEVTSLIVACDGYKTSSVDVTFIVGDDNEAPVCSMPFVYITVAEGEKGNQAHDGSSLTSSCQDPENQPMNYVIKDAVSRGQPFLLNSRNASLTYASSVDVKTTLTTSFTVQVCDVGSLCSDVHVEVEIRNVPKKPRIAALPRRLAVPEDMDPGEILVVKTLDEDFTVDEEVVVYFRVLKGDPEIFGKRDAVLYLKESANFNYERTSSHVLEFTASNGHLISDPVTLTLDVMDVNEAPTFLLETMDVRAPEGETGAVILPSLLSLVSDPDMNDTLTFTLLTSSGLFGIHPDSGVVSLAVDYDLDLGTMTPEVSLVVKATDSGHLSSTMQVTVIFENVNEAPRIVNLPREITVAEYVSIGRVIYRVVAEDPDGDEVIVRMSGIDPKGGGKLFDFNVTDGTVSVSGFRGLDFEDTATYSLRFTADDGKLTSTPMTLTLLVTDVNEPPYFTRETFYVSTAEGSAGTLLGDGGIFSSTRDPDGDAIAFHLVQSSEASAFSVDRETAELSFATDFVLTRQSSPLVVNLTIGATDPDGLTATARVEVTVRDVNRKPRLLYLPANITVPEDTEEGALLYTVYAEDEDGDSVLFRLNVLSGGGRELFHINSSRWCLNTFVNHSRYIPSIGPLAGGRYPIDVSKPTHNP